ncbi:MAG TPA: protease pro-enzyme activation domain-containing protein, partial [Acidobacteriaceae bacterium]|nr:protease pro-enzyme activation domain-containing protein [Acidobacteriaceae bacterium]
MKVRNRSVMQFVTGLACALLMLAPLAYAQVKPKITQTVDSTQRKVLPGTVHPLANTANDRGRADAGLKMNDMLLMLQPSKEQAAALKKYVDNLHNPASPTFHQWLTPEQYASQFGAHDADVKTVSNWLGSSGFAVEEVSRGRNWIRFSGNAAQVENAFKTQIHQYSIQGASQGATQGATKYANATRLSIPAALAPAVSGVVSMNNFQSSPQHTAPGKITRDDTGKLVRVADNSAVNPAITNTAGNQIETFLMPGDFSTIYDAKSVVASGTDGS